MQVDLCDRNDVYRAAKEVRPERSADLFSATLPVLLIQTKEQAGDMTMVINNAGVVSGKSLLDLDDASIQRTFDVNVIAHFWVRTSTDELSEASDSMSMAYRTDCISRTQCSSLMPFRYSNHSWAP